MKIKFLGTSHGLPDINRYCSSTLVEVNGKHYLIDGGAPVADILIRLGIKYESVKALFNTHFHGDHIYGAIELLSLINWYYLNANIKVYLPEQRACKAICDLITVADRRFDAERIELIHYDDKMRYEDENITLYPIATKHIIDVERPSFSFVIEAEGKKVLFSGDFNGKLSDFPEILFKEHFDVLITENAHFPWPLLEKKLVGIKCDNVYVNHIHPLEVKAPLIEKAVENMPFHLAVAHDGDEITL